LSEARGLTENIAWIDYYRTEAAFVSGRWTEAIRLARCAIELGERNAYHRPVVRAWFTLVPIAASSGDQALLAEGFRWFSDGFRTSRAPWWTAKSIRLLDLLGEASPELRVEAAAIDRQLGIA